jgi:membrane protein implicated in regulation of membrane protease activity
MWIIWLIIAGIFAVAEVFTPGFVLLWFAVGAAAAALLALLGITSFAAQIIVFLLVSVALVIASRTILVRTSSGPHLKTGVELMIGQIGTVVENSRGALQEGAVKVSGSVWTAFPVDGEEPLQAGESVTIERVEGNTVYVRRNVLRRALLFSEDIEKF